MPSTSRHAARRPWRRFAGASLPLAVAAFIALAPASSGAAGRRAPRSPVSGSVLTAQAVHAGTLVPGRGVSTPRQVPDVTVLPNVRVSNHGTQPVNEVPVTADPNNSNHLLSGGNDYNCANVQGFFASDDGGFTWPHQHCMGVLAGKQGFGDPNVAYGLDGTAYILGIDATGSLTSGVIAFEKSTDNGVTWSPVAAGARAYYPNGLTDKEWTEIDHSAGSPYAGCIYVSITQFDTSFNKETITVDHSCDGGTTWSGPKAASTEAVFPNVNQFSDLAIGSDGTVYVTWMNCDANGPAGDCGGTVARINVASSSNGGNTWSTPVQLHTVKLASDSCFCAFYGNVPSTSERVSEIPVIDIDNSGGGHDGYLYVADYDFTPGYLQLRVSKSTDGGATWGSPAPVHASTNQDQFLHWLSVDQATGRIGVTFLLRSGTQYAEYAGASRNGSAFRTQKIADQISSFSHDGFGGSFMGDYTGNIWAGGILHAVWPDTRTNVSQDEWGGVQT